MRTILLAGLLYVMTGAAFAHSLHIYVPGPDVQLQTYTSVHIDGAASNRYLAGGDLGFVGHTPNGVYLTMGDIPTSRGKCEMALFKIRRIDTGKFDLVRCFKGKMAGNMQWQARTSQLLGIHTDKGSLVQGMQGSRLTDMISGARANWSFDNFPNTGSSRQWSMLDDIDANGLYATGVTMHNPNSFTSQSGRAHTLFCPFARNCFIKSNWTHIYQSGPVSSNKNLYGARSGKRLYIAVQRLPGHRHMIATIHDWDKKIRHVQQANSQWNAFGDGFRNLQYGYATDIQAAHNLIGLPHGEMTGAFIYDRGRYWYLSTGWPGAWDALFVSPATFN